VIERERERLINLSRIFFYSNRTTHMREKKRNPKKRHLSLSLSALSIHALALFFFVLFTRANFCREARALSRSKTISLSLSLSLFEYILHIVYFVVDLEFNWPFFFQKSKRRKFFFKKFNNTFKQKRARIHITHRIHAQQRQQQQRRQVLYF
jgi:hypothetical protein